MTKKYCAPGLRLMQIYGFICELFYRLGIFRMFAAKRFKNGAFVVLAYHGISNLESRFFTTVETFKKHVEMFLNWGNPSTTDNLLEWLKNSSCQISGLQFLITFDDSHKNILENAIPILEKHNFRPAIFICPDFMEGKILPWWFVVPAAFYRFKDLKKTDQINELFEMNLKSAESFSEFPWEIIEIMKHKIPQEKLFIWVDEILNKTEMTHEDVWERFPDARIAYWDDILQYQKRLDVGSHTQSHVILGRCINRDFAESQIKEAKNNIETHLKQPCKHFAYPNGNVGDHTEWTRDMIYRCGHDTGFLTEPGVVTKDTDPLKIPRFYVDETPVAQLAAKIVGFERWWEKQVSRLRPSR